MKKLLFVLLVLNFPALLPAQSVSINTDGSAPSPGAILDIKSSTKGLLIPRTSTATRSAIFNGPNGLMFYDSTVGSFWFLNGGVWIETGRIDVPNNNAFFGYQSGKAFPTGDFNSGFGHEALFSSTTGIGNTSLGTVSMHTNTTGNYNTAAGAFSLYLNTTGSNNTAIGNNAMLFNQTGNGNVAVGSGSLLHNVGSHNLIAVGDSALFNTTAGYNTVAVGYKAGYSNSTGYENSIFGDSAGYSNTSGYQNTYIGYLSGFAGATGFYNSFVGNYSGYHNSGNSNSFFGIQAGFNNTSGFQNSIFGEAAGFTNTNGNRLTLLGAFTDIAAANLTNAVAIGFGAAVGCSNCMALGGQTGPGFQTRVGINNAVPTTDLHIIQQTNANLDNSRGIRLQSPTGNHWRVFLDPSNNYIFQYNNNLFSYIEPVSASYVSSSDEHLKTDINPLPGILDKLMLLQPKTYHYTASLDGNRLSYGFLAQDVEKLFPEFVFSSENGIKGIAYSNFGVIAIKAIQEQQEIINALQIQVEAIKAEIPMQIGKQQEIIDRLQKENRELDQRFQQQLNTLLERIETLEKKLK